MGFDITAVFKDKKTRNKIHSFLSKNLRSYNDFAKKKVKVEGFHLCSIKEMFHEKNSGITFCGKIWTGLSPESEYFYAITRWLALLSKTYKTPKSLQKGEFTYPCLLKPKVSNKIPFYLYDESPMPVLSGPEWNKLLTKKELTEVSIVDSLGVRVNQDERIKNMISTGYLSTYAEGEKMFEEIQSEVQRLQLLMIKEGILKV